MTWYGSEDDGNNLVVIDRQKEKLAPPPMYMVVFHNDDYTPMDFVVGVLMEYFNHGFDAASTIMFDVHKKGKGIAGTYTKDISETKATMVMREAAVAECPLRVTVEKVS